jgi:hypothetical protein
MPKKTSSSTPTTTTKPARKTIAKESKKADDAAATKATAEKATVPKKATKKEAAAPKVAATGKDKKNEGLDTTGNSKILELCLLLDCTGSMGSWIERSKTTLKEIIHSVKKENDSLVVRVCFVGYRDIGESNRFDIFQFSEDLDAAVKFISSMRATGGGDDAEDV